MLASRLFCWVVGRDKLLLNAATRMVRLAGLRPAEVRNDDVLPGAARVAVVLEEEPAERRRLERRVRQAGAKSVIAVCEAGASRGPDDAQPDAWVQTLELVSLPEVLRRLLPRRRKKPRRG